MNKLPCEQNNDISLEEHDARIEAARVDLENLEAEVRRGAINEGDRLMMIPVYKWQGILQDARDRYAALRREMHPDMWFLDPGSGKETLDGQRRRRAIQTCWYECPMRVRPQCLDIGLQPGPTLDHGIYGGRTEAERQKIVAEREEHERGRPLQTR